MWSADVKQTIVNLINTNQNAINTEYQGQPDRNDPGTATEKPKQISRGRHRRYADERARAQAALLSGIEQSYRQSQMGTHGPGPNDRNP